MRNMKMIRLRPDVVLRTVAGSTMLIAVLDAIGECPVMREVNDTAAVYLRELDKSCTEDDLVRLAEEMFDAEPELLREDIREFLNDLRRQKYLIEDELI